MSVKREICPSPWRVVLRVDDDAEGGIVIVGDDSFHQGYTLISVGAVFRWTVRPRWFGCRRTALAAIAAAIDWRTERLDQDARANELAAVAAEVAQEIVETARQLA